MPSQPEIFPKAISAYQSPYYTGTRHVPVDVGYNLSKVTIVDAEPRQQRRILSQLTCQRYSHMGRLAGEYVLLKGSMLAMDRDGIPLRINSSPDEDWTHDSWFHQLEAHLASEEYMHIRNSLIESWDGLQLIQNGYALAEMHADRNYYHFMTGFLPKIRRTANSNETELCLPKAYIQRPFQIDLLRRTAGHRLLSLFEHTTRVRDPYLVHEPFSRESVAWLRKSTGFRVAAGKRRIYVSRRSTIVGREHGSINETAEFLQILREFDFETIDFGTGDVGVEEQVRRLDGAAIVLSAHGANLTNSLFLTGDVAVLELLPFYWTQPAYMQMAALCDLRYFGIVCTVDEQFRLLIKPDILRGVIRDALR